MSCTSIAISDRVTLERSEGGLSLIASQTILPGEVALHLAGQPIVVPSRYSVQIDEGLHLEGPPESLSNYINHSCDPSCHIDWASLDFVAHRHINPGESITFHYCTSEWDMKEPFECGCGSAGCLGLIRGARYLGAGELEALSRYLSPFLLSRLLDSVDTSLR